MPLSEMVLPMATRSRLRHRPRGPSRRRDDVRRPRSLTQPSRRLRAAERLLKERDKAFSKRIVYAQVLAVTRAFNHPELFRGTSLLIESPRKLDGDGDVGISGHDHHRSGGNSG